MQVPCGVSAPRVNALGSGFVRLCTECPDVDGRREEEEGGGRKREKERKEKVGRRERKR